MVDLLVDRITVLSTHVRWYSLNGFKWSSENGS